MLEHVHGTGMRINECLSLRVKDVDFERREILIRDGKGFKDRITLLPQSAIDELREHLLRVELLHRADLRAGYGEVYMPLALARKYPAAGLINQGELVSAAHALIASLPTLMAITKQQ